MCCGDTNLPAHLHIYVECFQSDRCRIQRVSILEQLSWGHNSYLGRKPEVATALLSAALSCFWLIIVLSLQPMLPFWLEWMASACLFFERGNTVPIAVLLSMIADVVVEDTKSVTTQVLATNYKPMVAPPPPATVEVVEMQLRSSHALPSCEANFTGPYSLCESALPV